MKSKLNMSDWGEDTGGGTVVVFGLADAAGIATPG